MQYFDLVLLYFGVSLVLFVFSIIQLNNNLNLLENRKLRNEKVFIRANVALSKKSLKMSIIWPAMLVIMSYQCWKITRNQKKKAQPLKNNTVTKVTTDSLPPRVKPKQMSRRRRSE